MTPRRPDRPRRSGTDHAGPPRRRGSEAARLAAEAEKRRQTRRSILLVAAAVAVLVIAFVGGNLIRGVTTSTEIPTLPVGAEAPGPTVQTNVGPKPTGCPSAAPAAMATGETRTVTISTAKGTIVIGVKADLAPLAAANFVALADCGYYTGVVFHRLVPGFVIQGGDRTGTGSGGPGYTIKDEPVTTPYKRGTVAMARTAAADSQGSQFFIVLSDQNSLAQTNTYVIFGSVTAGMDVVDAIAAMPNSGSPNNTALNPVAMDSVTVSNP